MKKNNKIDLVILAGGKGSRVRNFLHGKPKPLLKINNLSFLQILLNEYAKYPFSNIYILAGYKGNIIYKRFNDKYINFIKIKCFVEKKLLGTAGALRNLKKKINNDFLLVNGDSFFDIKLNDIFLKSKYYHEMFLTNNNTYKSNKKLSNLVLNKNKKIEFKKKGSLMNAGIYYFKKNIFSNLKKNSFSLEDEILPKLIEQKKIKGTYINNYFIDIGTKSSLNYARRTLAKYLNRPAAFFDRDGVINHDYGYVSDIKKFKFKKGVIKALKFLLNKGYNIFIITNQAGIAKGKFTINDFYKLHRILKFDLNKKEINLSDVKYCPYHRDARIKKYRKNSIMRKPNNGMVLEIFNKWFTIKKKSFFIGDQKSDEICAKRSGIFFEYAKTNLFNQVRNLLRK